MGNIFEQISHVSIIIIPSSSGRNCSTNFDSKINNPPVFNKIYSRYINL